MFTPTASCASAAAAAERVSAAATALLRAGRRLVHPFVHIFTTTWCEESYVTDCRFLFFLRSRASHFLIICHGRVHCWRPGAWRHPSGALAVRCLQRLPPVRTRRQLRRPARDWRWVSDRIPRGGGLLPPVIPRQLRPARRRRRDACVGWLCDSSVKRRGFGSAPAARGERRSSGGGRHGEELRQIHNLARKRDATRKAGSNHPSADKIHRGPVVTDQAGGLIGCGGPWTGACIRVINAAWFGWTWVKDLRI